MGPDPNFFGAHACRDFVNLRRYDEVVLVQALNLFLCITMAHEPQPKLIDTGW